MLPDGRVAISTLGLWIKTGSKLGGCLRVQSASLMNEGIVCTYAPGSGYLDLLCCTILDRCGYTFNRHAEQFVLGLNSEIMRICRCCIHIACSLAQSLLPTTPRHLSADLSLPCEISLSMSRCVRVVVRDVMCCAARRQHLVQCSAMVDNNAG